MGYQTAPHDSLCLPRGFYQSVSQKATPWGLNNNIQVKCVTMLDFVHGASLTFNCAILCLGLLPMNFGILDLLCV